MENYIDLISHLMSFADDTYKTVLHSVNNKKVNIDKLKEQLKQIEADTAENLKTIDSANTKVKVS